MNCCMSNYQARMHFLGRLLRDCSWLSKIQWWCILGRPHVFVELSTSAAGLFGAHVKTLLWTKKDHLWLLSNNHQSIFLEILSFCSFMGLMPVCMGDCISACVQHASRKAHRTSMLNLRSGTEALSGDAPRAFWASWFGGLCRSEKPPGHSVCHSEESRAPEAGEQSEWLTVGSHLGYSLQCVSM